ncbi:hypothetical protein PpBr36_03536, partial [Pyricularia pennisetigena]|uniref:hypothetical protein n=1 Tax=Pyricularia pennisetigena TaxID=1578925 RepID=UPI0011539EEF
HRNKKTEFGKRRMSTDSVASYKTACEQMDADLHTALPTTSQGDISFNKKSSFLSVPESQIITMHKENRQNNLASSGPKINGRISGRNEITHYRRDDTFSRMKNQILEEGKNTNYWRQRFKNAIRGKENMKFKLERLQVALHDDGILKADLERRLQLLTEDKAEREQKFVGLNLRYEESRDTILQRDQTIDEKKQRIIALEDQVIDYENKHNENQRLAVPDKRNLDYLVSQLEALVHDLGQTKDRLATQDAIIAQQKESIANSEDLLSSMSIQLGQAQANVAILNQNIAEQHVSITEHRDQIIYRDQCIMEDKQTIAQLSQNVANAEKDAACTKQRLEGYLAQQKAQVDELQSVIAEQKQLIDERREADFEALVAEVSCKLPDSQIRTKFGELLGAELDDWCMEYKARKLTITDALDDLLSCGENKIVWQEQDTPDNLRFRFDNPKAPVILLQAALSNFLCKHFLQDPFFLLKMSFGEAAVDGQLGQLQAEHASLSTILKEYESESTMLQWRASTVEMIECRINLRKEMAYDLAKFFMEEYQALLKQQSPNMLDELSEIILNFARFCLGLWKRKVPVYVQNNQFIGGQGFKANNRYWDVTPLIGLERGDTSLDGRPMCVVVKPLVFTKSAASDGKETVWTKASVWVSNESAGMPITISL